MVAASSLRWVIFSGRPPRRLRFRCIEAGVRVLDQVPFNYVAIAEWLRVAQVSTEAVGAHPGGWTTGISSERTPD